MEFVNDLLTCIVTRLTKITSIATPDGNTVGYSYDTAGNRASALLPLPNEGATLAKCHRHDEQMILVDEPAPNRVLGKRRTRHRNIGTRLSLQLTNRLRVEFPLQPRPRQILANSCMAGVSPGITSGVSQTAIVSYILRP